MERLNQEADLACTALRHAEDEAARGLSLFGRPVIVEELDIQAQIRDLTRHMDDLRVHYQNLEDGNKTTDLPAPDAEASGALGSWRLWPSRCMGGTHLLRRLMLRWRIMQPLPWRQWQSPRWNGLFLLNLNYQRRRHLPLRRTRVIFPPPHRRAIM